MDRVTIWEDYLTEKQLCWLWCNCRRYVAGNRARFEDCLTRAASMFIDNPGDDPQILDMSEESLRIEYTGRGGRRFQTELRFWIERKIRSLCGKKGEVLNRSFELYEESHAAPELAESLEHQPCARIRDMILRMSTCLQRLSEDQRCLFFHDLRFGKGRRRIAGIASRRLVGPEYDHEDAPIPDECADEILGEYDLADDDLRDWMANQSSNAARVHHIRHEAKTSLTNCLLSRYGEEWRRNIVDKQETGDSN